MYSKRSKLLKGIVVGSELNLKELECYIEHNIAPDEIINLMLSSFKRTIRITNDLIKEEEDEVSQK